MSPVSGADAARFAAFSFVDRIIRIEGLERVTGQYTIPPGVSGFPVSLIAEAIGQLAAWVAMSHVAFRRRPVAALAGATEVHALPAPGQTIDLEVDIDSCDEEAIVYRGRASVGGQPVLTLSDTLGSMLDVEQFDDPTRLAADFDTLIEAGCPVGRFKGIEAPVLRTIQHERGVRVETELLVPAQAAFFEDHFPLRPVYPATLLLDAMMRQAAVLAEDAIGGPVQVRRITHVKVRSFTEQGTTLVLFAQAPEFMAGEPGLLMLKVGALNDGKTIAGARIYFQSPC